MAETGRPVIVELPSPGTAGLADALPLLERLERALAEAPGETLILRLGQGEGKPDEPHTAGGIASAGAIREWARRGQRCLEGLERAARSVALIEGAWFGPLMEVALACRRRAVLPGGEARCGFWPPAEGPAPAWGGSVRVTRLLGPGMAFELIRSGAALPGTVACRWGLAQTLAAGAEPESLLDAPAPRTLRPFAERLLLHLPGGRALLVRTIERRAGKDPGDRRAADLVRRALIWPDSEALEGERELLASLTTIAREAV